MKKHNWSGVTIGGVRKSLRQWSIANEINYRTITTRIRRGWNRVEAVTLKPAHVHYKYRSGAKGSD